VAGCAGQGAVRAQALSQCAYSSARRRKTRAVRSAWKWRASFRKKASAIRVAPAHGMTSPHVGFAPA